MDRLLDMRLRSGVLFDHLASVYEEYTGKIALENLRPSWLVFSTGFRKTRLLMVDQARVRHRRVGVRADPVASPLMLLSALLVKLESPRDPVLYHQERVGLNGATFTIHKFRTMRTRRRSGTGPVWSAGDQRSAHHRGRPLHAQDPPRRDPAAVERAARRHEPDRPAARAAGVRRAADAADSVLRPAPRREARRHRDGRRSATPTARASKTRSRRCSTTCTT